MASKNVGRQSTAVEPKSKKLKLDRSENNINADCPLFQLPDDILAKIVGYVPITQWSYLELVSTKFRDVTHLAWRSLRHINLEDDFKFEPISNVVEVWKEKFMPSIVCILEKLTERAPFIKSLKGVRFRVEDPNLSATAVSLLSKFENLESIGFSRQRICLYPRSYFPIARKRARETARKSTGGRPDPYRNMNLEIRLEDLIAFMESTRSRAKLKEIVVESYTAGDIEDFLDAFALRVQASLVNNAETRQRMRLEKLVIGDATYGCDWKSTADRRGIFTLLDNSTLTSLSLGCTLVEPELLSNLIQSAPNLHHLGFSFIYYPAKDCNGSRNEAYKRLMNTLATHPNVNELYFFESRRREFNDGGKDWQFETEFVQMLKSIGPRLRVFGLDTSFDNVFDIDQIAAIILNYMRDLKSIHLRVDEMSTEDIKNIVRLPDLEDISLKSTNVKPRINNDIIVTIGQSTCLKSLRLCASFFDDITGISLKCLAALSMLTKLEIKRRCNITNDVLVAWGNGFGSTLEELRLSLWWIDVDEGLIDLIKTTNRLRVLDLSSSTITDGILDAAATSCPNLEQIGDVYVEKKNLVDIQSIIDACPKLSTIRTKPAEHLDLRAQLKINKYRNVRIH